LSPEASLEEGSKVRAINLFFEGGKVAARIRMQLLIVSMLNGS